MNAYKHTAGSANQYVFSQIPTATIPRCKIKRPCSYKTTFDAGVLIPFFVDEVLPGDTHKVDVNALARMTTQIVPVMDNLWLDFQFFFVPYRLVWSNWERMHGAQDNPGDSTEFACPYISAPSGGVAVGSLADYFGLPTGVQWRDHDVNAFAFRAYNLIWNEWYRDQNLQNSVTVNTGDDPESVSNYTLLPRGKRKDYFTSALPWPQKGASVLMPIGSSAPVMGNGLAVGFTQGGTSSYGLFSTEKDSRGWLKAESQLYGSTVGTSGTSQHTLPLNNQSLGITLDPEKSGIVADLSKASAASIADIREAFQIQKLLERDARGGTRYVELLKAHFGVISPDARLQRPELLGSFSIPVQVQQIPQTSATESGSTAQGNLSAIATAIASNQRGFTKSFTEFGIVLGLVSVRSDLTYQQGIHRMWSRATRYDFYYPALSHLSEQAILNKELYADGTDDDDLPFGYQERWSEYKYGHNQITGELRSSYSASLDVWHLAQYFEARPTLSADFIVENPPISRILAVTDSPAFLFDSLCDVVSVRPMPLYCVPGLVDHF